MKRGTKGSLGFVYFIKPIGLPGPIKIGFSALPKNRLLSLAIWSPFPLEIAVAIPGTLKLEMNIHDCLARSHSHHEWFFPTDEVTQLVNALNAGKSIEESIDLSARKGTLRSRYKKWSEESKVRASYGARLRFAVPATHVAPDWAGDILHRWHRGHGPSQSEIDKLEQLIGDPTEFAILRTERYPSPKAPPSLPSEAQVSGERR